MREIKFRAWDIEKKTMHNDLLSDSFEKIRDAMELQEHEYVRMLKGSYKSQFEVMQYTGLKDKNGKEIYEGDILSSGKWNRTYKERKKTPSVVFWMDTHSMFQHRWDDGNAYHQQPFWLNESLWEVACSMSKTTVEIIGNIYSNPELIKS